MARWDGKPGPQNCLCGHEYIVWINHPLTREYLKKK
jgi:hypothetical protein